MYAAYTEDAYGQGLSQPEGLRTVKRVEDNQLIDDGFEIRQHTLHASPHTDLNTLFAHTSDARHTAADEMIHMSETTDAFGLQDQPSCLKAAQVVEDDWCNTNIAGDNLLDQHTLPTKRQRGRHTHSRDLLDSNAADLQQLFRARGHAFSLQASPDMTTCSDAWVELPGNHTPVRMGHGSQRWVAHDVSY